MRNRGFAKSEAGESPSAVNSNNEALNVALLSELTEKTHGDRALTLDPNCIQADPNQPRKKFDKESIQSLSDNIKEHGQAQAITVKEISDGQYQIIAGECRWRACVLGGLKIQVVVKANLDDENISILQFMENVKREAMTVEETAAGYEKLIAIILSKNEGMKPVEAASKLGLKRPEYYLWVSVNKALAVNDGVESQTKRLMAYTDDLTAIDSAWKLEEKDQKAMGGIIKSLEKKVSEGEEIGNIRKMVKAVREKVEAKSKGIKKEPAIKAAYKLENCEKINDILFLTVSNGKSQVQVELTEIDLSTMIGLGGSNE